MSTTRRKRGNCLQFSSGLGGANDGRSPLLVAAHNGHLPVVTCLVEHGADKDKATNQGHATPPFAAAGSGHLGIVKYLIECGADKDKAVNDGTSPLLIAAGNGHLAVVHLLVDQGVDVNKDTLATWGLITPLHIAVLEGHLDIAVCLMEQGLANLNARTIHGHLPIDMARTEEMRQAIRDEEIRRKDNHGFKRTPVQDVHLSATSISVEDEEEGEDDDDESNESSEDEDN